MTPKSYRTKHSLTLAGMAQFFGIESSNSRSLWLRYETGQSTCPAPLQLHVQQLTNGAVTTEDWAHVRNEYLITKKGAA
jgi:transcriptional regulator with XRE-family HTH domain